MSIVKKSMKSSLLVAAVSLSLMSGVALANGPFGKKGGGHHAPIERMIEKLDLSDEQIVEVENLMDTRASQRKSKFQNKREINKLVEQGNVDQAAELAANAARERVYEMAKFKEALNQILTPEQQAKMEKQKLRKKERTERRRNKQESDESS